MSKCTKVIPPYLCGYLEEAEAKLKAAELALSEEELRKVARAHVDENAKLRSSLYGMLYYAQKSDEYKAKLTAAEEENAAMAAAPASDAQKWEQIAAEKDAKLTAAEEKNSEWEKMIQILHNIVGLNVFFDDEGKLKGYALNHLTTMQFELTKENTKGLWIYC